MKQKICFNLTQTERNKRIQNMSVKEGYLQRLGHRYKYELEVSGYSNSNFWAVKKTKTDLKLAGYQT
jgi:hypothetical protein